MKIGKDQGRKRTRPKEPTQREIPKDPLERCELKWRYISSGVWKALIEWKPSIAATLHEAFKDFDLGVGNFAFIPELFEPNPSDDLLKKAKEFSEQARIPDMRGRKPSWRKKTEPYFLLNDYYETLHILKSIPRGKVRNLNLKILRIKERLPEILSGVVFIEGETPEVLEQEKRGGGNPVKEAMTRKIEGSLKKWFGGEPPSRDVPEKELTRRIVAQLYGMSPGAFEKTLQRTQHEDPDLDRRIKKNLGLPK